MRQRQIRSKQTLGKQKSENCQDAKAKAKKRKTKKYPGYETNEKWNKRLDDQEDRQRKHRGTLTKEQKEITKQKDAFRKEKERENENEEQICKRKERDGAYHKRVYKPAPPKKPYTSEEEKYYGQKYWERISHLRNYDHSLYNYFLRVTQKQLQEGDRNWIENKILGEILKGSDVEILSKKFAVIFDQLGIAKKDVVHFVVSDENLIYVALFGLWILGGIGSFGNKHFWRSSEKILALDSSQLIYPWPISLLYSCFLTLFYPLGARHP